MTERETRIVAALERKWHITTDQTQPGASGCNALQAHRKKHLHTEKQMYVFNIHDVKLHMCTQATLHYM